MAVVSSWSGDENPEESRRSIRDMMGPQAVDQAIRQAITTCWMMLPDDKKNVAEVESEIRRLVDRALQNMKEDERAFGGSTAP